jgi:hypothetical protein
MFARLRMSVAEAMTEFSTIIKNVYIPQFESPSQRTQSLRINIEDMLTRHGRKLDINLEAERRQDDCAGYDWI